MSKPSEVAIDAAKEILESPAIESRVGFLAIAAIIDRAIDRALEPERKAGDELIAAETSTCPHYGGTNVLCDECSDAARAAVEMAIANYRSARNA